VRLRSDQRHHFDAAPNELWAAMVNVDQFQRWWPWLRRFDASGVGRGDVWRATVQPPLPYRVSLDLLLTEVSAPLVVAVDVTGDIEGSARLEVHPNASGSELHFTSELTPTSSLLRTVARFAPPIARYGHEWVLNTGLAQFRDQAL
jgi:Polyketide cyclase / dehydrase and lipid transport